jgi:hypothetical protein
VGGPQQTRKITWVFSAQSTEHVFFEQAYEFLSNTASSRLSFLQLWWQTEVLWCTAHAALSVKKIKIVISMRTQIVAILATLRSGFCLLALTSMSSTVISVQRY